METGPLLLSKRVEPFAQVRRSAGLQVHPGALQYCAAAALALQIALLPAGPMYAAAVGVALRSTLLQNRQRRPALALQVQPWVSLTPVPAKQEWVPRWSTATSKMRMAHKH